MNRQPRLLVTDLDNTLYDWVGYFAASFYAMVDELLRLVPVERERLLDGFRDVHRLHHNSEHPFALLEVAAIRQYFGDASDEEVLAALDPALHAFNSTRKRTLKLYEGVRETLASLSARGTILVGHTEAIVPNACFRLEMLEIGGFLKHLYALDGSQAAHPRGGPNRSPPPGYVRLVPREDRKPNPALLLDICRRESVQPSEVWYVGDSLTRDIGMATRAGVVAMWARYGTKVDAEDWRRLVRITHWTDEDVRREAELKLAFADAKPDYTIDRFDDLLKLMQPPGAQEP